VRLDVGNFGCRHDSASGVRVGPGATAVTAILSLPSPTASVLPTASVRAIATSAPFDAT
jgi:hypothetical protein